MVIPKVNNGKKVTRLTNGMGFKELQKTAQLNPQTQALINEGAVSVARDKLAKELRFWKTIPKFIRPPKPVLADFLPKGVKP